MFLLVLYDILTLRRFYACDEREKNAYDNVRESLRVMRLQAMHLAHKCAFYLYLD